MYYWKHDLYRLATMLFVLSPAKTLDFDSAAPTKTLTAPRFVDDAAQLIAVLRRLSPAQVASLMGVSDAIAALNVARYADWVPAELPPQAKAAIFAFAGDVYEGFDATSLTARQVTYAQKHVRILSGLYGVLRALDALQPYRLEAGTRLANPRGRDLYAFWGEKVTRSLNEELASHKEKVLCNLASIEYFKLVRPKLLNATVVTPLFEDYKDGHYKQISFYSKKARGMMARYAAQHNITKARDLRGFDIEGYRFNEAASTETTWMFRRKLG